MENLVFRCPHCNEEYTLDDVVGIEKLAQAISWSEIADIYDVWMDFIRSHASNCQG